MRVSARSACQKEDACGYASVRGFSAFPCDSLHRFAAVQRCIVLSGVASGVLAMLLGSAAFWLIGGRYVGTEDVYFHAARTMIAADVRADDLSRVRAGNAVVVTADAYPGRSWRGTVATVHRSGMHSRPTAPAVLHIPVHIRIDPKSDAPPLNAGMLIAVSIDTGHGRWWRILHPQDAS